MLNHALLEPLCVVGETEGQNIGVAHAQRKRTEHPDHRHALLETGVGDLLDVGARIVVRVVGAKAVAIGTDEFDRQ